MQLPVADSDPSTELLNSAMRVARNPSDTCQNHAVRWRGQRGDAKESFNER
jgi:hypothetical protein